MDKRFSVVVLAISGLIGGASAELVAKLSASAGEPKNDPQRVELSRVGDATVAGTRENLSVTGTSSRRNDGVNSWSILDAADSGKNLLAGFYLRQQLMPGIIGNRVGGFFYSSLDGIPSERDNSDQNYVALTGQGYANAPARLGLQGGARYDGYAGSYWAMNPNAWLGPNARDWLGIYGMEVDVQVFKGASVADKVGILVTENDLDASRGVLDDAAVLIGNGRTRTGWTHGVEFGGTRKIWPFDATSTLIGATRESQPDSGMQPSAKFGVDLSEVRFSSDGAPLVMPIMKPSSSIAACKIGSIEWDAHFIFVCTGNAQWRRAELKSF